MEAIQEVLGFGLYILSLSGLLKLLLEIGELQSSFTNKQWKSKRKDDLQTYET